MLKQTLKKVVSIFQWLLTIVLVSVVLLLIFTAFDPVKSFQVLRVMSGSMEPGIKTGSVVFVKQVNPKELKSGDVITFLSNNANQLVTHRIVQISEDNKIITKGDANSSRDVDSVALTSVKGKVIFAAPYLGYISSWTKTPYGFILLIIIPTILIIINEIFNIRGTVKNEVDKKTKDSSVPVILLLFAAGFAAFVLIRPTIAFFSDGAVLSGNTFSTGYWISPTPTPEPESKVTICQATNSEKNPYVQISVSIASISQGNGHGNSGVNEGDIIPPTQNSNYPDGNNWTDEGQAIWNNNCEIPEPTVSVSSVETLEVLTSTSSAEVISE